MHMTATQFDDESDLAIIALNTSTNSIAGDMKMLRSSNEFNSSVAEIQLKDLAIEVDIHLMYPSINSFKTDNKQTTTGYNEANEPCNYLNHAIKTKKDGKCDENKIDSCNEVKE